MTATLNPARLSPIWTTWNAVVTLSASTMRVAVDSIARSYHLWQSRREANALAALSDEQLHDIGLKWADVARARALPLRQDPTLMLARTAEERRVSGKSFRINPRWRC